MNPQVAKVMADDGIAGVTALMAEQRDRGIAPGSEGEAASTALAGGNENSSGGQATAGGDAARQNGRT